MVLYINKIGIHYFVTQALFAYQYIVIILLPIYCNYFVMRMITFSFNFLAF